VSDDGRTRIDLTTGPRNGIQPRRKNQRGDGRPWNTSGPAPHPAAGDTLAIDLPGSSLGRSRPAEARRPPGAPCRRDAADAAVLLELASRGVLTRPAGVNQLCALACRNQERR